MWGFGHSLNFKGRYSTLDRRLSLNYLAPRYRNIDGRNLSFTALYDNTRDVLTFNARRLEAAAQFSQRLSKPTTVLWRYSWRNVKVDENTLKIDPLLIPLLSQPSRIAMIGANLIQDRRDDPANAHRGIYNSIDTGLAEHAFGGNKNFFRFLARIPTTSVCPANGFSRAIPSSAGFGLSGQIRISRAFEYVPLAEHFFGGGSYVASGLFRQPGGTTRSADGLSAGGQCALVSFHRLRFPFLGENINGVFFHDFGNIYRDLSSITFRVHQRDVQDFDYMVHAAGFGSATTRRGSRPRRLGVQLQSAYLFRPQGHVPGTHSRDGNAPSFNRASIFSFSFPSGRHSDMRVLLLAAGFATFLAAEVVDRVAVVVGTNVITESELLREVRLTDSSTASRSIFLRKKSAPPRNAW